MAAKWVLAAVVLAVAGCSGNSSDELVLVVQECQDSVQAHLTYDAGWPTGPSAEKDSSGTWHVIGAVTAQNGFGAKRTLYWRCTVDRIGNVKTTVTG